jgi:hypothetical protein
MSNGTKVGPYSQDILTRIVNVQWGGGVFSFAGNIFFQIVTYLPDVGSPNDFQLSWLGGTSKDGEEWESGGPSQSGLALNCCVSGKVADRSVTIAAGSIPVTDWYGVGYARVYGLEPAAGVSYDGGRTWSDGGIPVQQFTLKPADPITGKAAETAQGSSSAVAYHPPTQTFYVGASVLFAVSPDWYWEDRLYGGTGVGFIQIYSERREFPDPFPGYRWPEPPPGGPDITPSDRLRVADMTQKTPAGPGTLFVVSFGPDQHAEYTDKNGEESYVAVNGDRTGVILGGKKTIFPPMPVVNSVCGGVGHIVAVGWQDEDQRTGPVTYVSNDDGLRWVQQLPSLSHTNPGPEDKDSGSSGGSCSFSPG